MSELVRGSSVPLFDRLASSEPGGGVGAFLLLPEQLEASIARELSRLFNTRSRLMPSQYAQSTGTVIDYGVPDFSSMSPRNADDRELLQASLAQAVGFFEPRLHNVAVKVAADAQRGDKAVITVSGDVMIGLKAQRISFELGLDSSSSNSESARVAT